MTRQATIRKITEDLVSLDDETGETQLIIRDHTQAISEGQTVTLAQRGPTDNPSWRIVEVDPLS